MRTEIVAVGTELLLGQIIDSNSAWIAERLSAHGIECHYQTRVGDNVGRIVSVLRAALSRNDSVVVCGGLGPTQDDVTREAIAEVMAVPLVLDDSIALAISDRFAGRGREMPASNLRQAEVPMGAFPIVQAAGTAPGLICPVGWKVLYAIPGVPAEMREMLERAVLPDLLARGGYAGVIVSRSIRTWGVSESRLAEMLDSRLRELDEVMGEGERRTIAFLASGIEGIKVRVTVRAADEDSGRVMLDEEEKVLRQILGDLVFGVDDEAIEDAVSHQVVARGLSLATAESLTGGLVASRLVRVAGASSWFRGAVVAYDPEVKFSVLGVDRAPVVTEQAARQMAEGVRKVLGADIGLALTGVAGPDRLDGADPGTVIVGLAGVESATEAVTLRLPGDRQAVRDYATISALDLVRRRLSSREV